MNLESGVPLGRSIGLASLFAAACLFGPPAPAAAQTSGEARTETSTGLYTLARGHSAAVYLVDAGDADAMPTEVVLEVLDHQDTVLRAVRGELRPGQPVRLALSGPATGTLAFRARAVLETPAANIGSAPILTLEVFNQQTFDSFANATCRLKFDPEGTGGKVLGNCGSCETSVIFER